MHHTGLAELSIDTLHHAYGIAGDSTCIEPITAWITHADTEAVVTQLSFTTMGIDDARALKRLAVYTNGTHRQCIIVCASTITREAQNTLLKLFEEPVPGMHFFLIIPSYDTLLVTLRSRLQLLAVTASSIDSAFDIQSFMTSTASDRIALIEKLLKKTEDSDESKSAITRMIADAVEDFFAAHPNTVTPQALQTLAHVRNYQHLSGASHKMLLEYLALSI